MGSRMSNLAWQLPQVPSEWIDNELPSRPIGYWTNIQSIRGEDVQAQRLGATTGRRVVRQIPVLCVIPPRQSCAVLPLVAQSAINDGTVWRQRTSIPQSHQRLTGRRSVFVMRHRSVLFIVEGCLQHVGFQNCLRRAWLNLSVELEDCNFHSAEHIICVLFYGDLVNGWSHGWLACVAW